MGLRASLLIILFITCYTQFCLGNTLFHFAINFHIKDGNESSEEQVDLNQTQITENVEAQNFQAENAETTQFQVTTSGYSADLLSAKQQLDETLDMKLQETRTAVQGFNKEISHLTGRSDTIAAKVKLTTRYLNKLLRGAIIRTGTTADAITIIVAAGDNETDIKLDILKDFLKLVSDLKVATAEGGERSMEFMLINLLLTRHKLTSLESEVRQVIDDASEKIKIINECDNILKNQSGKCEF
ncbi:uncharacterized protein LOC119681940 [Teleopsis dalmanni]|uniref:uncharacterized protein LOC119681940 n=1 Tax=Teleopsis dalmanni TaxID=139649 RepID=UPI0018CEBAF4|nr:uncharacterized protein LOC119681940 [Teleopsis dalmanni]